MKVKVKRNKRKQPSVLTYVKEVHKTTKETD